MILAQAANNKVKRYRLWQAHHNVYYAQ